MKIHDVEQGTKEWYSLRADHYTASEAAAAMGDCKFCSRDELMQKKMGFYKEERGSFKANLLKGGHEVEVKARALLEEDHLDEYRNLTCSTEVEGLKLLASLDGISENEAQLTEYKVWNKELVKYIKENKDIPPSHYWQLEQQLLVTDASLVYFVVSDGTRDKRVIFEYFSHPERRSKLIAGWKLFNEELNTYEIKEEKALVVASEQADLPSIECTIVGSQVVSNLGEYIPFIKSLAEEQMKLILQTDKDFADKEAFNKKVKLGRASLKTEAANIEKQFESLAEFNSHVKQADSILQKLLSHGEKQVKESKTVKKALIVSQAQNELNSHLAKLSESLNGVYINNIVIEFESLTKGKRSFAKMEEAVNAGLTKAKIEANEQAQVIRKNLDSLSELAKSHKFLFSDHNSLLLKDNEDLVNLIKSRIAEHEKAEAERKQKEFERIEREAKEAAELKAQAKIKTEEARIREEERAKLRAEADKLKAEREAFNKEAEKRQEENEIEAKAVAVEPTIEKVEPSEDKEETVTISKKEYDELSADSQFYHALCGAGVDNWDGFEVAQDMIEEWNNN